jgi:hypothetical protein
MAVLGGSNCGEKSMTIPRCASALRACGAKMRSGTGYCVTKWDLWLELEFWWDGGGMGEVCTCWDGGRCYHRY